MGEEAILVGEETILVGKGDFVGEGDFVGDGSSGLRTGGRGGEMSLVSVGEEARGSLSSSSTANALGRMPTTTLRDDEAGDAPSFAWPCAPGFFALL